MFLSRWCHFLTVFSISAISNAMNRPVYKIVLNSKGYAQFIQYDTDLPTLREFTLCVWVRVNSLESEQTIFTYFGADDKRIMRLWLARGGRQMSISLGHDRVMSSANVEFRAEAWRDVCLSYQADHGAWALYVDAALVMCEGSQKLRGVEFPGEGSLIFGYGTSEEGFPTGLSGEIYGASLILFSTIERNFIMGTKPWTRQNPLRKSKNTDKDIHDAQYIVLGDLQTDEVHTAAPLTINKEYEIFPSNLTSPPLRNNMKLSSRHPSHTTIFNGMKIHDISIDEHYLLNEKDNKKYLNQLYKKYPKVNPYKAGLTGSGTHDLPIVLEFETPPPITASTVDYSNTNPEKGKALSNNQHDDMVISDVEKPPPPEHKPKVYGQWTGSKFASNVLNYLKSIDYNMNHKKPKKVPSTLSLGKLSDSYPYPSRFTYDIIRPPISYKKRIYDTKGYHSLRKRNIHRHEINAQIIKPDGSNYPVLLPNKLPDPKLVEVTNRGEAKREFKNKLHAEDNSPFRSEELDESIIAHNSIKTRAHDSTLNAFQRHRGNNLLEILPFINSKEYFVKNRHNLTKITESNRIYSSSLSNNNKQHNIKVHNNDYRSNVDSKSNNKSFIDTAILNIPPVGVRSNLGESIMIGRAIAKEVSNQAIQNVYSVPLLKYKHSLIPAHDPKTTTSNSIAVTVIDSHDDKITNTQNHFNKRVKLGNALNEKFIIGFDEHQIKNTFLDGSDDIPDINRHRSKWSSKVENIPASLHTRVCGNIELYVHEDEGIGKSKIKSPVQRRNIAIEFIVESYKKCSMKESSLRGNALIVIDWTNTPVKLFGGAYVKKTKDLCGFF